jgi:hypothetical protein
MLRPIVGVGFLAGAMCACSGTPSISSGPSGSEKAGPGQSDASNSVDARDCSSFDVYESALATQTVDCLGTIGPESFSVNADGFLRRNFDSCPLDPSLLRPIDSLLSLQYRSARLPLAKECMAGRYTAFLTSFAQSGVTQCPVWKKDHVVNPITAQVVDGVIPQLPKLAAGDNGPLDTKSQSNVARSGLAQPEDHGQVDFATGGSLPSLAPLEQNTLYAVAFDALPLGQQRATPAASAALCAGGFPGFVIRAEGSDVLTDPPAWLLNTIYPTLALDPYLRGGYYHPMSYYGGAPGVVFADAARACPIIGEYYTGTCTPESCSYYSGIHVKYPLQLDCLDPNDFSTCVGYCAPPGH